jgi:manganese-transporting P-type ATPase
MKCGFSRVLWHVQAEASLSFAGLAIFQAPLKPGSVPALQALAASSHQLVMITGDTALTACHTAAQVHIVDRPVAILTCDQPGVVTGALSVVPRS